MFQYRDTSRFVLVLRYIVHSTIAVSLSIVFNVKMHLNYEVRSQIVINSFPVFRTGLQLFCTDKYVVLLLHPHVRYFCAV